MDITKLIEATDYWFESDGLEILPEEEIEKDDEKLEESDDESQEETDSYQEKEVRAESIRHSLEKKIIGESVEDAAYSLLVDHDEWVASA